ncbi:MAG TPA: hypothetical protein VHB77_14300 [Planctomycetaceae bacterium]|nr:hypothetical protein [Planctomycetaceae bacterium]
MQSGELEFQIGERVRMRGGGPLMQVRGVKRASVQCVWRTAGHLHVGYFRPSMIERVEEDPESN